jgi:2-polyprenyl-3-methyl-5-hydroxy-6-metoxy-1,4-benzoquinol methylase
MTRLIACTVCRHPSKPDPFFYLWKKRRFTIHRCASCTHQFVHPAVTGQDQSEIYSDAYFSSEGDWVCGLIGASYVEAEPQLRSEAREVLSMLPASPGWLLDVGCAGGVFLDEARAQRFAVAGIELNPAMAKHARETYRLDVHNSPIEAITAIEWRNRFDVVTLLDCLEHIPEPHAALSKVASWLRPGGHVFIRGPLSDSRFARLKESVRRTLGIPKLLPGYPLDANMFNRRSLERLLSETGFAPPSWINATKDFANLLARKRR